MVNKVNHIGVIVADLERALAPYEKGLGLKRTEIEHIESLNIRVAFLPIGDTLIELIQPLGDIGELAEFLQTTGGGLHHIAVEVDDVYKSLTQMESAGIALKDRFPWPGAHNSIVAFVEREGFNGVVVELVQLAT